jgi:hypothetical protein
VLSIKVEAKRKLKEAHARNPKNVRATGWLIPKLESLA